jgi:hypothetical protein
MRAWTLVFVLVVLMLLGAEDALAASWLPPQPVPAASHADVLHLACRHRQSIDRTVSLAPHSQHPLHHARPVGHLGPGHFVPAWHSLADIPLHCALVPLLC